MATSPLPPLNSKPYSIAGASLVANTITELTASNDEAKGGYLNIVQYLADSFEPIDRRNTKKERRFWWQWLREMRKS
jgi:hypothetical protein